MTLAIPRLTFEPSQEIETNDWFKANPMEVGSVGYDQPEPPRWVVYENSTGEEDMPVSFDVINMRELVRNMPEVLVSELFEREFVSTEGYPFRVAEPCMDTGDTLFRGHTMIYCNTREAGDALDWIRGQADHYSFNVTLQTGERIAIDNRRCWVRHRDDTIIERGLIY